MITVVAVGCGDRTTTYLEVGVHVLKKMKVVAAIDPNPERLRYMQEHFDVPAEACFRDMYEVLSQGRIADCVIDGTMDQYHLETALPFLSFTVPDTLYVCVCAFADVARIITNDVVIVLKLNSIFFLCFSLLYLFFFPSQLYLFQLSLLLSN